MLDRGKALETVGIPINVTIPVTRESLADIVCTAVEGGINYWCDEILMGEERAPAGCEFNTEIPAYGGTFRLRVPDNPKPDGDEWYILDEAALVRGLSLAAGKPNIPTYSEDDEWVGDVDATAADVIVQYGLFGEVVFG